MGVSEAVPCHPNRGTKTTSAAAGAGIAQLPRHSPCLHFTEHILYVLGLAGVPAYAAWCMLHTFTVGAGLTLSTSRSNLHSILASYKFEDLISLLQALHYDRVPSETSVLDSCASLLKYLTSSVQLARHRDAAQNNRYGIGLYSQRA